MELTERDYADIYPLTILHDRYDGAYSGGPYTAWKMHFFQIPVECVGDDPECSAFWQTTTLPVGKGNTPDEAVHDLLKKINEDR